MNEKEKEFHHPECKDGEIFLSNVTREEFQRCGFKSKRLGVCAYSVYGRKLSIPDFYPVFVSKQEYRDHLFGKALDEVIAEDL